MAVRGPAWWLCGLVGVAALALLRFWDPSEFQFDLCVFRATLDLPCPGCGLTRSVAALARGNLTGSAELHPLGPAFALEAGLGWLAWGWFGRDRLAGVIASRAEALVAVNVVPLFALWLGRAATGTLPF